MAARFWVGGAGNWSDAATHWSDSSGGAPSEDFLPTIEDQAIFDENSSEEADYEVVIDIAATCLQILQPNPPTFSAPVGALGLTLGEVESASATGTTDVTPAASGTLRLVTIGSATKLEATFANQSGTPTDPTTVACSLIDPETTQEDINSGDIVRTSVGVYHVMYEPTINGLYQFRFVGTGAVEAAAEGAFMAQSIFAEEEEE